MKAWWKRQAEHIYHGLMVTFIGQGLASDWMHGIALSIGVLMLIGWYEVVKDIDQNDEKP